MKRLYLHLVVVGYILSNKVTSTICITEHADVTLLSVARAARIESIVSRLAQLSIADALYVIIALGNIDATTQNEKRIWDALLPKMY